jgi:hypothetical protein
MTTGSMMNFDYGDAVELVESADIARFGIVKGSVCGFRTIDAVQAPLTRLAEGTVLVLVEGERGPTVEIPGDRLKRIK